MRKLFLFLFIMVIVLSCNHTSQPKSTSQISTPEPSVQSELSVSKERLELVTKILEQTAQEVEENNPVQAATIRVVAKRIVSSSSSEVDFSMLKDDAKHTMLANALSIQGNQTDAKDWLTIIKDGGASLKRFTACENPCDCVCSACSKGNCEKCCILCLERCN